MSEEEKIFKSITDTEPHKVDPVSARRKIANVKQLGMKCKACLKRSEFYIYDLIYDQDNDNVLIEPFGRLELMIQRAVDMGQRFYSDERKCKYIYIHYVHKQEREDGTMSKIWSYGYNYILFRYLPVREELDFDKRRYHEAVREHLKNMEKTEPKGFRYKEKSAEAMAQLLESRYEQFGLYVQVKGDPFYPEEKIPLKPAIGRVYYFVDPSTAGGIMGVRHVMVLGSRSAFSNSSQVVAENLMYVGKDKRDIYILLPLPFSYDLESILQKLDILKHYNIYAGSAETSTKDATFKGIYQKDLIMTTIQENLFSTLDDIYEVAKIKNMKMMWEIQPLEIKQMQHLKYVDGRWQVLTHQQTLMSGRFRDTKRVDTWKECPYQPDKDKVLREYYESQKDIVVNTKERVFEEDPELELFKQAEEYIRSLIEYEHKKKEEQEKKERSCKTESLQKS